MWSVRKLPIIGFALMTVVSISLVSYSMYLYFESYNAASVLDVLIKDINVIGGPPNSAFFSIDTTLYVVNPGSLSLTFNSVTEELYLNSTDNYLGEGFFFEPPPNVKQLPPFSNDTTVTIRITNVPRSKVSLQSPKTWYAAFVIWIYGIPVTGAARFIRFAQYPNQQ